MKVVVSSGEDLLYRTLTRWGHDVTEVRDGNEAQRQLAQDDPPKLAILDCEMPVLRGPELCRRLRTNPLAPYIYVMLLLEENRKDDLMEALEQGADDYLLKPFDGYELRAKLMAAQRILSLQDRLLSMRDELLIQATHDSLTGLWNRKASLDALGYELVRTVRERRTAGLMLADIDHFKQINDTYGHLTGDRVLQAVATRLKNALRSYDMVGRYGGEEFLIVLPGCDESVILRRGDEIRISLNSEPMEVPDGRIPISISIGAAVVSGAEPQDEILKSVDDALYRAKRAGRNRVELARQG
jgi:diguanylate cyclase (GGDEF)-like protein